MRDYICPSCGQTMRSKLEIRKEVRIGGINKLVLGERLSCKCGINDTAEAIFS